MRGLTDKPAVKDNFQIESYINGLYKIDVKREKTLKDDIVALLGDNPFPELGEPDITDNGIYYRDLMPFNVDEENENVYYQMSDLFCNQFEKIKQYFV